MADKKKKSSSTVEAAAPAPVWDLDANYPGIPQVVTPNTVDILKAYQPTTYEQYKPVIDGRLARWVEAQSINEKALKLAPVQDASAPGGESSLKEVVVSSPTEAGGIVGVISAPPDALSEGDEASNAKKGQKP